MALEDELKKFANRPITQKEVEEVKSKYTLQPDVTVAVGNAQLEPTASMTETTQPVQPSKETINTPTAPMPMPAIKEVVTEYLSPSTNIENVKNIKQQVASLKKSPEFTDYLPYLAPLAVEALFGGGEAGGVSAEIAGKALLGDEAKKEANLKSLEDKLMEMKTLKSTVKYGGGEIDKEAGKQARFEASQKQRQELADRQIKLATRDKLNQNKEFQANLGRYNATNDAINVLNQKNWAGDAGVGFLFAKGIFREVGALTNEERTQFIADPLLNNKFTYLYEKYLKEGGGTFTEKDRRDLTELAIHMRERAKQDLQRVANSYIEGVKSIGIDTSGIIKPLLKTDDVVPKYINTGIENRPKYYEQNGFIYKLNEKTGKYE
jgi:hypothetical protein